MQGLWKEFVRPRISLLATLTLGSLLLSCPLPVFPQQAAASINGIVNDPASRAVEGALLTLVAIQTGVIHTTVSNGSGAYAFVNIPPAKYALTASKDGFKSTSTSAFSLAVNQTAVY